MKILKLKILLLHSKVEQFLLKIVILELKISISIIQFLIMKEERFIQCQEQ